MDSPPQKTPSRNEPCHCGSDRKYKQCCLDKDEAAAREARAAQAAAAPPPAPDADADASDEQAHPRPHGHPAHGKGGSRVPANPRGFQKATGTPRKVGGG